MSRATGRIWAVEYRTSPKKKWRVYSSVHLKRTAVIVRSTFDKIGPAESRIVKYVREEK